MNIFFGKILFLPVMTKKMFKSKEHCSPTRSKTVFFKICWKKNVKNRSSSHTSLPVAIAKPYFFDILLKKGRKKAVATLTEVAPDDQSRNDKQKWSRPFDQKKWDYGFPGWYKYI